MVPGPDCTEGARRCSNGISHTAMLVSAGQYADVHCRATEQFHARACLYGKITQDLIGLQKTNNTSHFTVGEILKRHSHDHSELCTYNVTMRKRFLFSGWPSQEQYKITRFDLHYQKLQTNKLVAAVCLKINSLIIPSLSTTVPT